MGGLIGEPGDGGGSGPDSGEPGGSGQGAPAPDGSVRHGVRRGSGFAPAGRERSGPWPGGPADGGPRWSDDGPRSPWGAAGDGPAATAAKDWSDRSLRAAGTTAVVVLAAVGLFATAACSTGSTGARDAGPAPADQGGGTSVAPDADAASTASPPFQRVDAVRLVQQDPRVSDRVKGDLKPCAADAYPVDTSYGNLTNTGAPDVVVNVLTCGDAVGIGTYVYRRQDDGAYENVFALEEPAVYSAIDRGDLLVTKQRYGKDDPVAYPSGEDVITFRWTGDKFTQHDIVRTEYSKAVDGDLTGPVPVPADE